MCLACLIVVLGVASLVSMLWTASRGAPWVPTPVSAVHRMLAMAEVGPEDVVYDLGCGDGRLIIAAARRHGAWGVGIELDPLRHAWCRTLTAALGLRSQVRAIQGDLFSADLRDADVVTCHLLQGTNEKLEAKLKEELRPTARGVERVHLSRPAPDPAGRTGGDLPLRPGHVVVSGPARAVPPRVLGARLA